MKKRIILSLLTASSLFADAQMDAIKEQLQQQAIKTAKLEAKLNALEQKNTNNSASFSQNAYLPDMAFILNMSAVGRDVNNDEYSAYELPGFIDSPDTPDLPFNANRGFNFNYAEVALHSVVDPYFEAFAIFHISPEELEIEEAYVQTTSLPYSLRIKAGKFRSNFGRLNEKHHHVWNFDSQPLIYKGLFGPDMISDAGVQLQWVAPTDTYLMFGGEAMQGGNERSFGDTSKNNLYIGYIKSSIDVGDDLSILAGLSYAHGKNTTDNDTDVYGADLTFREQLGSYSALIWQSEYLQRDKKLSNIQIDKQAGLYSELVYQYNNNYSFGARYDLITKNDTDLSSFNGIDTDNLDRYTIDMDYKPFPMSRLRLSYTYDRSKIISGERKDINEVMLSLNIAAGAHGAHDY